MIDQIENGWVCTRTEQAKIGERGLIGLQISE